MKPYLCTLSLLLASMISPALAQSDSNPTVDSVAGSAVWRIQISPARLFSSNFGRVIEDMVSAEHPDALEKLDGFSDALGFNPFTDVQEVLLYGEKFDDNSANVIARLGATSGNLEGWFLAAPGYQSEDLDKNTILHSFIVEKKKNNPRLWCAIPYNQAEKSYTLIATFNRDQTVSLSKKIDQQGSGWLSSPRSEGTFLSLVVSDLSQAPMKIDSKDPGAAIVKTIRSVNLRASAEADTLIAQGELTADSPARAQQLQQLLNGLKAMVQLAAMQEGNRDSNHTPYADANKQRDHEGAKKAAELLNNLTVDHQTGSSTLTANFKIDYDALVALKNEMQN
ncbi:hypothetical protein [Bythopirellula polymerisocia]|uniref:Uncharacterized protein n=1 Tax=Bythopirellula polymerisocia TaxID=2528003 RepID=A0A5C6D3C2_9BACT|nr:hypothetical protein [Bythopirellula polymerisocia]TWU30364.1 hypothetical protein Pla144_11500 [Bythopirellula polymerisocia]